jgi:hypothetical protein
VIAIKKSNLKGDEEKSAISSEFIKKSQTLL